MRGNLREDGLRHLGAIAFEKGIGLVVVNGGGEDEADKRKGARRLGVTGPKAERQRLREKRKNTRVTKPF